MLAAVLMATTMALGFASARQAAAAPTVLAYVGAYDTIAVIDTSTDEIVDLIDVGPFISDVSVNSSGTRVYVSIDDPLGGGPGALAVIDTSSNDVIARIPMGVEPHGIAPSRDGSKVYVAVTGGGTPPMGIWVIDTATNTVADVIPLEANPAAVALSGDDACLFVGHLAGEFSVINPATRTVVNSIALDGAGIDSMVLSPNNPTAFVANGPGNGVAKVNIASHRLADVPLVGYNVQVVVVRPGSGEIWATATPDGLFVLDGPTGHILAHIDTPGYELIGIDLTPDGEKAYVATQSGATPSVLVIDADTRAITNTIQIPNHAYSKGHFITFPAAVARAADAACRPINP